MILIILIVNSCKANVLNKIIFSNKLYLFWKTTQFLHTVKMIMVHSQGESVQNRKIRMVNSEKDFFVSFETIQTALINCLDGIANVNTS